MLLDSYDQKGLLCQATVRGETGRRGTYAYRGDLVILEGQLREGSDKDRKSPEDKVLTLYDTAVEHQFSYASLPFAEARQNTIAVKLFDWCPV
jgi:hypothetical protein